MLVTLEPINWASAIGRNATQQRAPVIYKADLTGAGVGQHETETRGRTKVRLCTHRPDHNSAHGDAFSLTIQERQQFSTCL